MQNFSSNLTIATRKSKLAMWQAEYVQKQLHSFYPNNNIDILGLSTKGDEVLDKTLAKIGGKGLFTKELEDALYNNQAQLAVHSLKDVTMTLPSFEEDFLLGAILARDDARDAFISNKYTSLDELPQGAVVGTASLRRSSILKHLYPHLTIKVLRGNINTRLAKLDNNEYDAIILACAGLKRLELDYRISQYIPINIMLPSPAQAALGIEIYGEKYLDIVNKLNHKPTQLACLAEREVSKILGGSCQVPLAAYAFFTYDNLYLESWVLNVSGEKCLKSKHNMLVRNINEAQALGKFVAQNLLDNGAAELLNLDLNS